MSGRTVEGQRPEVDTYGTQISCPNCEEMTRGLHHNPTLQTKLFIPASGLFLRETHWELQLFS